MFARLVGLVLRSQLPSWFQPYAELEATATYISTCQCQLVYGLLQTPEYARAVLSVEQGDRLDGMVAARMERQHILSRDEPPVLWVVLDEAALYRQIGGRDVMRDQLACLRGQFEKPWMQDLHYCESYDSGHMTANPQVIRERSVGYARLQAEALPEGVGSPDRPRDGGTLWRAA